MEIKGESIIATTQEQVWEGLNDPDILRQSIPGCESLEKEGESQFKATVVTKIGPITAKFKGEVELQDLNPPHSYTIAGSGSAGAMGAAKGKAYVTLKPHTDGTHLSYTVNADMNGRIAQLGGRLIQSTAGILAGQFFKTFSELVGGEAQEQIVQAQTPPSNLKTPILIISAVVILALIGWFVLK